MNSINFFWQTAVWTLLSRKPQPSIYIRCLLQALIVNNFTILGTVPVKDFLYDELAELVLPSNILLEANTEDVEVPSDPRFQIAQKMNGFVKRFSQVNCFPLSFKYMSTNPRSHLSIRYDVPASTAVGFAEHSAILSSIGIICKLRQDAPGPSGHCFLFVAVILILHRPKNSISNSAN